MIASTPDYSRNDGPAWRDEDPLKIGWWPYSLEQVSPRCFAFVDPDGLSNVSVVVAPEGLVVIDATIHPYFASRIESEIKKHFAQPILYAVNTHFHRDHTFGNQCMSPEHGLVAHQSCAQYMRQHAAGWLLELGPAYDGIRLQYPDVLFDGASYRLPDISVEVTIHLCGGHTHDSCFVTIPEDQVVVAGDTVFNRIAPYVGRWSCLDKFGSIQSWLAALKSISEHQPRVIVPGHGVLATSKDVDGLYRFFEYYAEIVLDGVRRGRRLKEIWADIYRNGRLLRAELDVDVYMHIVMSLYYEQIQNESPVK